jgi:hypothetical protein
MAEYKHPYKGPGLSSPYSNSLRGERFGVRTPVVERYILFSTVQIGSGTTHPLLVKAPVSFTGIKATGGGSDHPTPSSAEVNKEQSCNYTPSLC